MAIYCKCLVFASERKSRSRKIFGLEHATLGVLRGPYIHDVSVHDIRRYKQESIVDTINVLGYTVIVNDLNVVPLNEKVIVNTISPNSFGLARKDEEVHEALKSSDYLVLDGLYFGLAALVLERRLIRRITGWDCFVHFATRMNELKGRCFFLGSTPDTLSRILDRFKRDYPNAIVASYSPPFKEVFSEEDDKRMCQRINEFRPDILFVGLTAPKQEKWAYRNIKKLDVHVICGIGNVFDWYAGTSARPGKFWQLVGLEWLVRIYYRPEIFRRNIGNQMAFIWHLMLVSVGIRRRN